MSTQLVGVLHNTSSRPLRGQLVYASWNDDPADLSSIYYHGKAVPDIYLEPGKKRKLVGAARAEPFSIKSTPLSAVDIACQGPARVCTDLISQPTTPGVRVKSTQGKHLGVCIISDLQECVILMQPQPPCQT